MKMRAVLSLTDKNYKAKPLRRVYIEKKDKKKKRPLGIPTMYDRAMQALYALALEPVAALWAFLNLKSTFPSLLVWNLSDNTFCIPSNAIFARIGDITPPCGVPSSVGNSSPLKINPALRNCFRTDLSIRIFSTSHS